MTSPIIPSSVPTLHRAIAEAQPESAAIRMATVATISASGLGVRVANSDEVTPAGWVQSYRPMLGDVVAVSRQDSQWIVLGTMGSTLAGSTAVRNYNFSAGAVGSPPPNWQIVSTSGTNALTTQVWSDDDLLDGRNCARLSTSTTGSVVTEVVSDPIPVSPGEVWAAGGYVRTHTDFNPGSSCAVAVAVAWYADDTLGSLVSQVQTTRAEPVARGMDWRLIRVQGTDGIVCPAGAGRLRVKFPVTLIGSSGDAIYFNRVIARRL